MLALMPQFRNLIAFFWVAVAIVIGFAWWDDAFSLRGIVILLVFWSIAGLAAFVLELVAMPTDQSVPKHLRIAGQVLRGTCVVMALLLVVIALFSIWREYFG